MRNSVINGYLAMLALVCADVSATVSAKQTFTDEVAFVSIRNGNAHIFLSNGPGTDRQLTTGESINTQPAWSHDGKQIAFTSNEAGFTKIFLIARDGSNQRPLTGDQRIESAPSWSPDGKSLAFYSTDMTSGAIDLRIVDVGSGKSVSIAGNGLGKGPESPVWSGDSRRLAFMGLSADGKNEVWIVQRDGSGARMVSQQASKRNKAHPALSPDGSKVAYIADMRGSMAIMLTDLDTGHTTNLTDGVLAAHENPRWSPDGKRLLFASTRDDEMRTRMDIFVMNADGTGVRNLSRHPHEDFNAHWTADGRGVVFISLRTGTAQIFAIEIESEQTLRLTANTSHDMEPVTRPVANEHPNLTKETMQ